MNFTLTSTFVLNLPDLILFPPNLHFYSSDLSLKFTAFLQNLASLHNFNNFPTDTSSTQITPSTPGKSCQFLFVLFNIMMKPARPPMLSLSGVYPRPSTGKAVCCELIPPGCVSPAEEKLMLHKHRHLYSDSDLLLLILCTVILRQ